MAFFMRKIEDKTCPNCNLSFKCGGQCWCANYPPIMEVIADKGCYCPKCLHEQVVQRIKDILNDLTEENLLKIKNLGAVQQPVEGIDYLLTSSGEKEFTQWYHLRNGNI